MNTKLIKISENDGKSVVSARELYEFLESSERFSKWFERMVSYGLVLDVDYTPYQMVHPQNNQSYIDYALTLDTAKEISMLQRSDKGKQARMYFIECEKQARNISNLSRMDILKLAVAAEEENLKLKQEIEIQEQKNQELECVLVAQDKKLQTKSALEDFGKHLLGDEDFNMTITEICDRLQMKPGVVNKILEDLKILKTVNKQKVPTEKYKYSKYCRLLKRPAKGNPNKIIYQLFWSSYGEALIIDKTKGLKKDSYSVQLIPINQSSSFIH